MLDCLASGKPKPTINWYKNEQPIKFSTKHSFIKANGSLLISNLNDDDSGTYKCEAKSLDKYPTQSLNYTLKVVNLLESQTVRMSANETDSIEIDCKLSDDELVSEVSWFFNDTNKIDASFKYKYDFTIDKRKLILFDVVTEQSGLYLCLASTDRRNLLTKVSLQVSERVYKRESRNKIVMMTRSLNESVVLDCTWWWLVDPLSSYLLNEKYLAEWTINGKKLLDENHVAGGGHELFLDNHNTLLKLNGNSSSFLVEQLENRTELVCSFKLHKQSLIRLSKFVIYLKQLTPLNGDDDELTATSTSTSTTNSVEEFIAANTKLFNTSWHDKFDKIQLECPFDDAQWYFNSTQINLNESSTNTSYNIVKKKTTNASSSILTINELIDSTEGVYTCNQTEESSLNSMAFNVQIAG